MRISGERDGGKNDKAKSYGQACEVFHSGGVDGCDESTNGPT